MGMQMEFISGTFTEKIPYVKAGTGEKSVVIFPPTNDLIFSLQEDPESFISPLQKFFPPGYIIYILGYDRHLSLNHSHEKMVDEYAQIVRQHIGPAYIAGLSYGGFFASIFAAKYPELTQKLFLIVWAHTVSESGLNVIQHQLQLADSGKLYELNQSFHDSTLNPLLRGTLRLITKVQWNKVKSTMNPISTFINAYRYILTHNGNNKQFLSRIRVPTLVVGADQDQLFSEACYRETAQLIPNAQLVIFQGVGHHVAIERSSQLKKALFSFL
jgi:pimeloyl-ACP methyl ester carboxylesterase